MAAVVGMSGKGAPGVSLGMWCLFHCWPHPVVGVEADVSGGVWALRHGLTCEPGLASLAASRVPLNLETAREHAVRLGEDRHVVCAPREGVIVSSALTWMRDRLLAWPTTGDLLVDVGRVTPTAIADCSPLARADAVVMFMRPWPEDLGPAAHVLAETAKVLRPATTVHLVIIGTAPYSGPETLEALHDLTEGRVNLRVGAVLPDDPAAAMQLRTGGKKAAKIAARWYGPLARELAAATAHRMPTDTTTTTTMTSTMRVGG